MCPDFAGREAAAEGQTPENENARKFVENHDFAGVTGEAGIRTRGTGVNPYNGLANRRLQPLGHLSKVWLINKIPWQLPEY